MFSGGNKNYIQIKRERWYYLFKEPWQSETPSNRSTVHFKNIFSRNFDFHNIIINITIFIIQNLN
jgi:hypothetical protein